MILFKRIRDQLHKTATWLSFYLKWAVPYFQTLVEVIATPPLWIFLGLICLTANISFITAPMLLFLCAPIFIGYGLIQLDWKTDNNLQAIKNATTVAEFRDLFCTQENKIATLEVKREALERIIEMKRRFTPREKQISMPTSVVEKCQNLLFRTERSGLSSNKLETNDDDIQTEQTEQVSLSMESN